MENLKRVLAAVAIISLMISCSSEDSIETTEGILGEWTAVAFNATITSEVGSDNDITRTETDITGLNFDYDLTFTESDWSATGGYDTEIRTQSHLGPSETITETLTDVAERGTYIETTDRVTFFGRLFDYDMTGLGFTSISNNEQSSDYTINEDGSLLFIQNQSNTTSINGISIVTTMNNTSTWVRR